MSRDALIVGTNTYQYLPSLQAPAQDAEAVAQQLHTYGEFRVHRLPEVVQSGKPQIGKKTPVTLQELETALVNLFKPKGNSVPHTAVFYFSGHGIQREAGIREGFLATSDANPDKGIYGLSLYWLRRLLQESPVRQRVIILDCCHSGEILNFLEADPGARAGTDRLFIAASREYETAYESLESHYSVLTQAILSGLDPSRVETGVVTNHSLTDWVNHSLKGEIQQPLFESSGSEIILTRQTGHPACPLPKVVKSTDVCPYRGLACFEESDAEFFFGREALTAQLVDKLQQERFVAVLGASGSGKSSLVRAGLIARLRQQQLPNGKAAWHIKLLTPADHPLKSLAAAFIDLNSNSLERAEQLRRAEAFLQDGGKGLAQLVQASLSVEGSTTGLGAQSRPQMLLVIDQFEEMFSLAHGAQAESERQKFLQCLMESLSVAGDCFHLLLVVRSDFLSKCAQYPGLAQLIEHHQLTIAPLKYEQIKASIVRPAQKVGLVCEPNLVYTMLLDIIGAPGELPLLQYTLLELWEHRRLSSEGSVARLTLDTYRELGGVRGTLQKRATEVYYSLTEEEQAIAKRIFLSLTQLGEGTEDTRRRVAKSELVSPAYPVAAVDRVLEKLVSAKLVVTSQDCRAHFSGSEVENVVQSLPATLLPSGHVLSQEVIDVAHEALIRNWSLLRDWLNTNRDRLRRQRRIELTAQEWESTGKQSHGDYLLQGLRLRDAEDFLRSYPDDLSALAQQYIAVSQAAARRVRRQFRQTQVAVPATVLATLVLAITQYQGFLQNQAQQTQQTQLETARDRAQIARDILQDPNTDPTVALLIGRLAAEQGEASYLTQTILRSALQNLRLQFELRGHQKPINRLVFSPDQQHLATASQDGTVRLWSLDPQTIYNTRLAAVKVLPWQPALDGLNANKSEQNPFNITDLAFSPDGRQLAAIAQDSTVIKIWSTETGAVLEELPGPAPVTQVLFSPDGQWLISAHGDRSISLWRTDGQQIQRLSSPIEINRFQLSPNGQSLLIAGPTKTAYLWQIFDSANQFKPASQSIELPHDAQVNQAIFSPDGRWIATASADGKASVWNGTTGKLSQELIPDSRAVEPTLPTPALPGQPVGDRLAPLRQLRFSQDGQQLAVADTQQRVWVWRLTSGQFQVEYPSLQGHSTLPDQSRPQPVAAALLNFSPDGEMLVSATLPGSSNPLPTAHLWDIATGQEMAMLPGHPGGLSAIEFSPDGTYVVTAGTDSTIRFWAAEAGGELPTLKLHPAPAQSAMFIQSSAISLSSASQHFHPEWPARGSGRTLPSDEQQARSSEMATTRLGWSQGTIAAPEPSLVAQTPPTVSPGVNQMIAIAADGQLQSWQILTDRPKINAQQAAQQTSTGSMSFLTSVPPQNLSNFFHWVVNLARGRSQRLSAVSPAKVATPPMPLPSGGLNALSVIQHSGIQHSGEAEQPDRNPVRAETPLTGAGISPDGQWVATANLEGRVEIKRIQPNQRTMVSLRIQNWRSTPGRDLLSLSAPQPLDSSQGSATGTSVVVRHLSFSPNGLQVIGIADDLTVRLWDVQTGQLLQVFQGHDATVQQARFSPDGQFVVTVSLDRTARIWQIASGQLIKTFTHPAEVTSASFSPDGQRLVTTSWDGMARVFEVRSGQEQLVFNKHGDAVLDAQFSPDGRLLATASQDGSAWLWEAETGEEQAQLRPAALGQKSEAIVQVFFSPDGQYVATRSANGQIYLWAATWDMLLKLAHDRSLRQLTPQECDRYLKLVPEACPSLSLGNASD
jgi:WD40 repeat protein/ABC-type dipeptide/oligopeptide/nickel transport system ATPase component